MSHQGVSIRAPMIVLVLTMLVITKETALAAEWSGTTNASIATEFNSNKFLSRGEGTEVSGLIADVSAQLSRTTPTSTFSVGPTLRLTQYPGQENLDSKRGSIATSLSYPRERSTFQIGANVARDSTVTSELNTTGFVATDKQRNTTTFESAYSYEVNPVGVVEISGAFTKVAYIDAAFTGLYGYDYNALNMSYRHALAKDSQWNTALGVSDFQATDFGSSTRNYSLNIGYSTRLLPTFSAFINVGERFTQSEQSIGQSGSDTTEAGWLINTGITQEQYRSQRKLMVSRNVEPSGSGALNDKTALSATFSREFSLDLTGVMDLSASHFRSISPGTLETTWKIRRGGLSLSKQVGRNWSLGAQYQRHWQHYDATGNNASSHQVFLSISYVGSPKRFSINTISLASFDELQ